MRKNWLGCMLVGWLAVGCGAAAPDDSEPIDALSECALIHPETEDKRLWETGGVLGKIPYVIDYGACASTIENAIAHYHQHTNIRFVPKNDSHGSWIRFVPDPEVSHVDAYGMQKGKNAIHLHGCYKHVIIHEIGHELGLMHEQRRHDRDQHIVVHFDRIKTKYHDQFGKRAGDSGDFGHYDHQSIMHYPSTWFAKGSAPTMTKKVDGVDTGKPIGKNLVLSARDIAAIAHLYGDGGVAKPTPQPLVAARSGRLENLGACAAPEAGRTFEPRAALTVRDCSDAAKQKWERITGERALVNERSGLCAHVVGDVAAGSRVEQRTCDGSDNQEWKLADVQIVSKLVFSDGSPMCLDVPAANYSPGTELIRWSCHDGDNQRFDFRPRFDELVVGGMCLAAKGGAGPGHPVVLEACNGSLRQKWVQGRRGFRSKHDSDFCLAISGEKVVTAKCNGGDAQTFALAGAITPFSNPSLCLRGSSTPGFQLRLASCSVAASQHWKLWSPE